MTNMYPSDSMPEAGIFVRRQVDALRACEGVEVEVFASVGSGGRFRYIADRAAISRSVRDWRPDLVHVHFGFSLALLQRQTVPLVCTFHGSDLNVAWKRGISHALAGGLSRCTVPSDMMCDLVPKGVPVDVVPCGVDTSVFHRASAYAEQVQADPKRPIRILFPSSPSRPIKDFSLFQAVVDRLRRDREVAVSVLENDPPRVVAKKMQSADVLLMTSVSEGSPVTIREALCMGTRVVSVDVGDVSRWLSARPGCRVVESRSVDNLAEACADVLSENLYITDDERYSMSLAREAETIVALYRALLSGPNQ